MPLQGCFTDHLCQKCPATKLQQMFFFLNIRSLDPGV